MINISHATEVYHYLIVLSSHYILLVMSDLIQVVVPPYSQEVNE